MARHGGAWQGKAWFSYEFGTATRETAIMPKRPREFKPRTVGRPVVFKSLPDKIRSTNAWIEFSKQFRRDHPLCFDPYRVHYPSYEASEDTHHIIPLSARPDLAYDYDNCAAVCRRCHGRLEGATKAGRHTRQLFDKGPAHA